MTEFSGYEDGFSVGFEEGHRLGYSEGLSEVSVDYETRISALWIELTTLTARVDYLEHHTGLKEN